MSFLSENAHQTNFHTEPRRKCAVKKKHWVVSESLSFGRNINAEKYETAPWKSKVFLNVEETAILQSDF